MLDDLGREAMAGVGWIAHADPLPRQQTDLHRTNVTAPICDIQRAYRNHAAMPSRFL